MFYLLGLLAVCGYALQDTLMAPVYRQVDALLASALRGLALGLTMLPLLLFGRAPDASQFSAAFPWLAGATVCAALGNTIGGLAMRLVPVAIRVTLSTSIVVIVLLTLGVAAYGEHVSAVDLLLIALLVSGTGWLSVLRGKGASRHNVVSSHHVRFGSWWTGVGLSCGAGILFGAAFFAMSFTSRTIHPVFAGYLWEVCIGWVLLVSAVIVNRGSLGSILGAAKPVFVRILVASSPTVIGTGCYTMASAQGSVGILGAILSLLTVASAVFARFLLGETLTNKQWILIVVLLFITAALRASHG